MNILVNLPQGFFSLPILEPQWARLSQLGAVTRVSCDTPDELRPHLRDADALLMWSWPSLETLLDGAPRLRFVGHIDATQRGAKAVLERGLAASISRRGFSPAVSELALALILACLRRTSNHHAAMWRSEEIWVTKFPDDIDADERQLSGRRVGIVGLGGVGGRLAQLLAPFECDIAVHDPFLPLEIAQSRGVRLLSLDELVAHSEVLVLCASANAGSKHLLEARHIRSLAPKSVLVNVARASLVDADALLQRLRQGDLYAALDVFDQEPLAPDSAWRALPNVYLSPHRAGGVHESVERIIAALIDDLVAFARQEPRHHALTLAMLPTLDA